MQYPQEISNNPLPEAHSSKEFPTPNKSYNVIKPSPELLQAPYQPFETIIKNSTLKRKNYKGRSINEAPKVKKFHHQLLDTRNIARREEPEKNVFSNAKKVDSGIKIKILPKKEETKRIIIQNPRLKISLFLFFLSFQKNIVLNLKIISIFSVTQLIRPSENLKSSIELAKNQVRQAMQKNA